MVWFLFLNSSGNCFCEILAFIQIGIPLTFKYASHTTTKLCEFRLTFLQHLSANFNVVCAHDGSIFVQVICL